MKAIKFFKFAVLATIVLFSACSKDDDTNPDNPEEIAIGTIRAKVDGSLKIANIYVTANINSHLKQIQIAGTGQPSNILQFNLGIGDFKGVGTYDLGVHDSFGLGINALYSEVSLGSYACTPQYAETTGKVTVTEYIENKKIKGTFQFKGKKQVTSSSGGDYINVTEGEFNVSLE